MEHLQTALERFKRQRQTQSPPNRLGPGQPIPPPIVYSRTRSLEVPESILREQRILAGFGQGSFVEAYKILRTQVLLRLREEGWNVLTVTSPGEGEGKTLTAINLAISLAMDTTQTVLLVDANLAKPCIHELFGMDEAPGLVDYLFSDMPVEELLIHPGIGRLVLMPGGRPIPNSSEALTCQKMAALVQEFRTRYASRVVVFDLPPLLKSADALAFSPYSDALLLVAEEGRTTVEEVQRALELVKGKCPVLGTVLNKAGRIGMTPAHMRQLLGSYDA